MTPLLVTDGGRHWKPVQTCSLEDLPPLMTSGGHYWRPVQLLSPSVLTSSGGNQSRWYAFYWNAFLLNTEIKNEVVSINIHSGEIQETTPFQFLQTEFGN